MKKLSLTILSVLLFCTTMTCNVFTPEDGPHYTADGRLLVPLEIFAGDGSSSPRALTLLVTEAVYNYIEVMVLSNVDNEYYDAYFRRGATGLMEVPDNTVINPTPGVLNAVIFAGYRRSAADSDSGLGYDITLLAIGIATELRFNGTPPGAYPANRTISPDVTGIAFTLRALETNVTTGTTMGTRRNSFEIIGPPAIIEPPATFDDVNGSKKTLVGGTSSGAEVPCFSIPLNQAAAQARFTVNGFLSTDTAAFAGFSDPISGVYVMPYAPETPLPLDPPGPALHTVKFVWGGDPVSLKGYVLNLPNGGKINPATALAAIGNPPARGFRLEIDTRPMTAPDGSIPKWEDGWALVGLNIPVKILADVTSTHRRKTRGNDLWHIKSGLYAEQPDKGFGVDVEYKPPDSDGESYSLGGGVLLKIGNPVLPPTF